MRISKVLNCRLVCRAKTAALLALLTICSTLIFSTQGFAEVSGTPPSPPNNAGTPSASASSAHSPSPARATKGQAKASTGAGSAAKPLWSNLSPLQQEALAPLAAECDKMVAPRKKKWLTKNNKKQSMKPEAKARLHERMREWTKLTPEQRRVARESYARTKKLNPSEKTAQRQQYLKHPADLKKKLAEEAAAKKRVTTLPSPLQSQYKLSPPPKSTLNHIGANATLPASSHSSVDPAIPPASK